MPRLFVISDLIGQLAVYACLHRSSLPVVQTTPTVSKVFRNAVKESLPSLRGDAVGAVRVASAR